VSASNVPPINTSLAHNPAGTSAGVPHHPPAPEVRTEPPSSSSSRSGSLASKLRLRSSPPPFVPPTTLSAVKMIITTSGYRGLYTGWRLHFIRDTMGTALYFAEYDVMRHWLGRKRDGTSSREGDGMVQGDVPDWAKGWLPKGIIPFLCGSFAGVTSWALIYPVDVGLFHSCSTRSSS
jgi:solute carrier family 25 carnitine/acylcarnitine transporter 20/29